MKIALNNPYQNPPFSYISYSSGPSNMHSVIAQHTQYTQLNAGLILLQNTSTVLLIYENKFTIMNGKDNLYKYVLQNLHLELFI